MHKEIIQKYISGTELNQDEMFAVFENLLNSDEKALSQEHIKSFLIASSKRLPTAEELTGAAMSLRQNAQQLNLGMLASQKIIDTCGTGGSGLDAFNTSTVASFVLSSFGLYVAKHGNRAATSKCGSADLLMELGAKIDLSPSEAIDCLERSKFTFLFAPYYHQATKRVQTLRKELGIKTIFNYLGPLSNPLNPKYQLLGVSNKVMLQPMAEALSNLGVKRALVCCGGDGLDEITLTTSTDCLMLCEGIISELVIDPKNINLDYVKADEIKGETPAISKKYLFEILNNIPSPRASIVKLNAAAGFFVAETCASLEEGLLLAEMQIANGLALASLNNFITISKSYHD